MNNYLQLIERISAHVISLFDQYQTNDLMFHNLEHTKTVVKRTSEIAAKYPFEEFEIFILLGAAWFHDTGHLDGGTHLHEDRSVIIMRNFLEPKGITKEIIDKIESCICATKIPQRPKSIMEEIICDADTFHLGTEDFLKTDELLKKEFELRNIPVDNWEEKTLSLLQSHKYFTPYCQAFLNDGKAENINLVSYLLKENSNIKG